MCSIRCQAQQRYCRVAIGGIMKAPDFSYVRPDTLQEALAILADDEAMPLAGGQSLMPMMNFRLAAPETIVDLNAIDDLRGINVADGIVKIGAMTRYAELAQSDEIATHAPLIRLALPHIAHAAIRNRGTIGGSIALADPAAEMPAVMLALGATVEVEGANGKRRVAADDFFLGLYETALEDAELITAISIPQREPDDRFGFYELARRHGDYAMAGVAIAIPAQGAAKIAFFGNADRAIRATGAELALSSGISDAAVQSALDSLDALPFDGDLNAESGTKRHLAGVVLKRALKGLG